MLLVLKLNIFAIDTFEYLGPSWNGIATFTQKTEGTLLKTTIL